MLNKITLALIATLLAISISPSFAAPHTLSVNLNHYAGTWHTIARIPNLFDGDCACSYTTYKITPAHLIVSSHCKEDNATGKWSVRQGIANPIINTHNTQLSIRYSWPFHGTSWIVYHDAKYHYVISGTPDHDYLWINARKPFISARKYKHLVEIAKKNGFPVDQLKKQNNQCFVSRHQKMGHVKHG